MPGESIIVLDDSGWETEVKLTEVSGDYTEGEVLRRSLALGEPKVKVTIYQGLLKADKFEYILQKGTELGMTAFVPLITKRCVVNNLDAEGSKFHRWQQIIREAAEQSGRGRLPRLLPATLFESACENVSGLAVMPWEGEKRRSIRQTLSQAFQSKGEEKPFQVNLFLGPEGGFTNEEVDIARGHGFKIVSLGPRILRSDTAATACATIVLYEAGELDP